MKYSRIITLLAASTLLASFSAVAYDKDGGYDKDGDGKHHHKKHKPMQRYTLTGGATYLAPAMNGLDYVDVITTSSGVANHDAENLNPNYSWGYFLAFGYKISSKYDVQASWQQYNSSQSETTDAVGPADFNTASLFNATLGAGETLAAKSEESLKTQAFDATLGQYHTLSKMMTARAFVGVKYAQVNDKTENTYGYAAASDQNTGETYNSKFSGVGPELGMDAEYKVYDKLGVIGHLAAAFLVGDLHSETEIYTGVPGVESAEFNSEHNNRVVPALDAKLGLNWNSLYANNSFGVGIEGGYQVAYYYDVVDQVQVLDAGSTRHNYADVGIMGPYLNLIAKF